MPTPVSAPTRSLVSETAQFETSSDSTVLDNLAGEYCPPTDDAVTAALVAVSDFMKQTVAGQRALKRTEDQNRVRHQKAEADELREKASDIRTGAIVSGVMLATSAGLTFSGSVASSDLLSALAQPTAQGADVSEKLAEAASIEHQANSTEQSALAEQAESRADDAKTNAEDASSILKKAHEAVQAIQDSRNAARLAILNARA